MDEIQKTLCKVGRKDLAQKYYLKVSGMSDPVADEHDEKVVKKFKGLNKVNLPIRVSIYRRLQKPTTVGKKITVNDPSYYGKKYKWKVSFTVNQNISNDAKLLEVHATSGRSDQYLYVKGKGLYHLYNIAGGKADDYNKVPSDYKKYID